MIARTFRKSVEKKPLYNRNEFTSPISLTASIDNNYHNANYKPKKNYRLPIQKFSRRGGLPRSSDAWPAKANGDATIDTGETVLVAKDKRV